MPRDPEIRAITAATSIGEVYEAAEFLCQVTAFRPGLASMSPQDRHGFWRDEMLEAVFGRGLALALRTEEGVCGVALARREGDKAVIVVNETSLEALESGKALLRRALEWANTEGLRTGVWKDARPVFIEIRA